MTDSISSWILIVIMSPIKNLRQYSLIGAWLTIALVALVHNEFEYPKYLIYEPPFEYKDSMR